MWVYILLLQEQQWLFDAMEEQGIPLRYTHCMHASMPTTEMAYAEQLVNLADVTFSDCQHTPSSDLPASQQCHHAAGDCQWQAPPLVQMPDWLANLAKATAGRILGRPDTFRWDSGGCHTLTLALYVYVS